MKRVWILLAAIALTIAILALAMALGGLAFRVRSRPLHEGRLQKVMRQRPTVERLTQGLIEEGSPLIAAPAGREEIEHVIARLGGPQTEEIRGKAARYPRLRVFHAADMTYFIFFDADGVMRDFTCVNR